MSSFSFVSCYKVKSDTFILSGLTTPFDTYSWISILFSVSITALILTLLPRTCRSERFYAMIGVLLENSVACENKLFQERFPAMSKVFGVRILLGVWILTSGTFLTNWYKTSFTMDMIVPALYTPPWETWLDIQGMEALLPLNMFDFSDLDARPPYLHFHKQMQDKFNKSTR
ncbi:7-cyano-7-deazaguanine synthase [Folsomia candida]|uniref:7-cyano-7-deazaguanine synthase n=1 Tax=Folsomia candida TaxID=158441 RepID=A0A226DC42_FOLCA|nr:7-cyano-7-deazaguanine synthase [Folsomia candida]